MIEATAQIETILAAVVALITTAFGVYQKIRAWYADEKTKTAERHADIANRDAATARETAQAQTLRAKQAEADLKTYDDLMNPYVPQTEEQTALILSGKVSDGTWRMSNENFERMYRELTESGAVINKNGLRWVVDEMERKGQVEYGISCEDHDRNANTECMWAFVSYGVPEILPRDKVRIECHNRRADLWGVSD